MSNIDIQNMQYGLERKRFKIFNMQMKNYIGTYNFIVRQTINYEKKANGKDSNKFITIISNPDGNYIDYVKGNKKDKTNLNYGVRCVFKKGNTLITVPGSNPENALLNYKISVVMQVLIVLVVIVMIVYLGVNIFYSYTQ